MDALSWDGSQVVTNNTSSLWSSLRHDLEESFIMSNPNSCIYGGNKFDLANDIFNPIHQELEKAQAPHLNSSSTRVSDQMVQQLAPISSLDSINVVSNMNLSQCQESSRLAQTDSALAKSGANSSWGDGLTQGFCSSPALINRPYVTSPLSGIIADFGTAVDQSHVINGIKVGIATTTCSLESLDCLLSATNSNTDTSVADDGIFSDCRNLWSFGANTSTAASSGESENDIGSINPRNKDISCPVNELDETVSHSSSDYNLYVNGGKFAETKPSAKRSGTNHGYFNLIQTDSYIKEGGFRLISENQPKSKRPRWEKRPGSSNISFQQPTSSSVSSSIEEPDRETIAHMKEMIYRAAAFRPVNFGLDVGERPKRKNVRISTDPQTVAARQRRERISERIRVLQRLVPGGCKMDTASMLDEAANYLKFLRSQIKALENLSHNKLGSVNCLPTSLAFPSIPFNHSFPMQTHLPLQNPNHIHNPQS